MTHIAHRLAQELAKKDEEMAKFTEEIEALKMKNVEWVIDKSACVDVCVRDVRVSFNLTPFPCPIGDILTKLDKLEKDNLRLSQVTYPQNIVAHNTRSLFFYAEFHKPTARLCKISARLNAGTYRLLLFVHM